MLIGAFFRVYNALGHGFLEKVYENALAIEARKLGLEVEQQMPTKVYYGGNIVGEYFADLAINNEIIVELKSARAITPEHEAQLINYLKAIHFEVGLLLNFGLKPEFRRRILDNNRKGTFSWDSENLR
ncbi:MAG: GxxExxY protein [Acidobacteriota bacterium]|nr:GxxExxY protein [Acidobacteriota bacterium]